ncbi:MAG: chaperonin GroEL [Candidatus Nanosynbacter sp. P5B_S4_bin.39.1]|jgi:chaperonin GroL|uniref:60 kDa chaperonin n=1 Tax=Candidatus Minimicrobia vallesae TaxID=2841264 RepID=A0A8F1MBA9_9BACT|nr:MULTISPECIES: chaperonin GroEL [Candidatus Saccharibacteria]MBF1031500.1 chaperonin GroEL [Candidatus Nanosynbacter sp.]MCG5094968.1 chaperonin GroEL [Candidatus Saccharibacteria bacterium]MCP9454373.1 chaperonin GroEL [Candidatus Nanosynbacter sp. P11B_S7_bin.28.1]MCP9466494.1 chaperonin GroEL [Candidatus Nanosynbacter sp. P5B_S4_bin.39.1]TWP13839.1 chaperonin GroEL [TM7 phylum sp. oral taxon 351]TWP14803.1 chaperonin GroEL [TM7 phylum sp. oral taxon 352]
MAKKVFYDDDARNRVLGGAKSLYDAVKVTYGPKGRNVVIAKGFGGPTVTHDGVTVAEGIELPENDDETLGYKVGADLIKQAAKNLNKQAGDGTTTVTVLTYSILKEANRLIAAGHNPMELRKGIEQAGAEIVKELNKLAEPIEGKSDRVAEVATISAGDAEIGKLIAGVIEKVGKDGVVTVEAGQGLELEAEVVEGFSLDKGWVSPFFVTDAGRQEAVYEKPAILITDKKISSVQEFLPMLEKLAQSGKKDVVLIADEVEGEALSILVLNKLKGVFNTVAVKAPSFGDRRKDVLRDIAVLTGATVISEDHGLTFENAGLEVLGSARKVIVGKDETTIIEGAGKPSGVKERIAEIKSLSENASSEYEKEQFDKRAAALSGKVAVIKVGGATETEIDEKKFRVDDAVAATKAALAEGIVAGGGVTLVNLAGNLKVSGADSLSVGRQILKDALKQPFLQIMKNAGLNADALLAQVESGKPGFGVNVMKPEDGLIDVKKAGVIDPARVTKEAVQNAVSIASTAATMGALVVDIPEAEVAAAPGGMPGMGMM